MLSQDAEDNVLTDCNAMNMLEGYDNPIKLEGSTDRQVEESLKVCLKECIKRRNIDLKNELQDTNGVKNVNDKKKSKKNNNHSNSGQINRRKKKK